MSGRQIHPPTRDQRDPQRRNLGSRSPSRDMSWRKPVPKLIPPPQISSNQLQLPQYTGSPTVTTFGHTMDRASSFSMSLTSLNNGLPPLPNDWKENIDRVVRNESPTNLKSFSTPPITPVVATPTYGFARGYNHTPAVSPLQITEADKDLSMFQEVDLGEMKSRSRYYRSADKENVPPPSSNRGLKRLAIPPSTNESNASTHRVPKAYRPPTPPLPSRKKTSAPPTPDTATMNKPMHIVYPDLTGLGAETHNRRTRSPDSDDTVDTYTLRTTYSSLTMWTGARGTSTDTSTLADDDDRILPAYQPHSVRKSTIGSKAMLVVEPHDSGHGSWKALRLWFDPVFSSFKSCLSDY